MPMGSWLLFDPIDTLKLSQGSLILLFGITSDYTQWLKKVCLKAFISFIVWESGKNIKIPQTTLCLWTISITKSHTFGYPLCNSFDNTCNIFFTSRYSRWADREIDRHFLLFCVFSVNTSSVFIWWCRLLTCSHRGQASENQPDTCHTSPLSRRLDTYTFLLHHTVDSLTLRGTADG